MNATCARCDIHEAKLKYRLSHILFIWTRGQSILFDYSKSWEISDTPPTTTTSCIMFANRLENGTFLSVALIPVEVNVITNRYFDSSKGCHY